MKLQQGLSVNKALFKNGMKGRDPFTYKTSCSNFFCAMKKSYYVSILLKTSAGTAKIFHNETFKDNSPSTTM